MKKIVIVGSNSYISERLIGKLRHDKISFTTISSNPNKSDFKLDLENIDQFDFNIINEDDFIVFLAAVSSPDHCQNEFKKSFNINVIGTIKFIEESIKRKANVIFFSSDTVYGAEIGQNDESVHPSKPVGEYALMKLSVENYFRNEQK